jgi:hypothetical protein
MGIMHPMTTTGMVMSGEGRVRLMLNKYGRQLGNGYGGSRLVILFGISGTTIMLARAPDKLLLK